MTTERITAAEVRERLKDWSPRVDPYLEWPEQVPILSEQDIYQGGGMYDPEDKSRSCLMGHMGPKGTTDRIPVYQMLVEAVETATSQGSVAVANDRYLTPGAAATLWNITMERAGYTEIEEVEE